MSDERDKRGPAETEGDVEKLSDVEAHKMSSRMGEADEKRETDEGADVEGHMLGSKHSSGKFSPGKHSAG
jgi:hypothetical protein